MNLKEIKAREQAATPGPWDYEASGTIWSKITETTILRDENMNFVFNSANADFIAHARTDIPALIAEVERLTAENADLKEVMSPVKLAKIAMMQIEFKRLQAENATLKKALELAVPNGNDRKCYLQQAQQTHVNETQGEAEK